jgi:hypothetical protein
VILRQKVKDTHQKALQVNLDPQRYGTFAEIGAGQEVARWFFRVGGAAGTIAKTISAYDMKISDAIYGDCDRYVSRERLDSMLTHEHNLCRERLNEERGDNTCFFAFADTVVAQNYSGTNQCHGWLGFRFQSRPGDEDNQIVIHLVMKDSEATLQQEALGIVGVNLVYGACFLYPEPEVLLESLLDCISTDRIEIDMIAFSGIEFRHVDDRAMSLRLVQLGLSRAAMFGPDGKVVQPMATLRKKPILVERGSFRPVSNVNLDMMRAAREEFDAVDGVNGEDVVELMEITMNNLTVDGDIDIRDFLARVDLLSALGKVVMVSDYFEYYRLGTYLRRYTDAPVAITMGAGSMRSLFEERHYEDLDGGILESFGRLFRNRLLIYVYPFLDPETLLLTKVKNLKVPNKLSHLYKFLVERKMIRQLEGYNSECLNIFSRELLKQISTGNHEWESAVPEEVAEIIKKRGYFHYKE